MLLSRRFGHICSCLQPNKTPIISKLLALQARESTFQAPVRRSFYDWRTQSDTVFAPATSIDQNKGSPLAIIRISGPKTKHVIQQLTGLTAQHGALLSTESHKSSPISIQTILEPRQAKLVKIFEPNKKDLLDIGLVIWFPGPKSYTGEDVCEFHIHGSQAIVSKLLYTLGQLDGQLRPAEPGEFTRRAVRCGKLSLLEAESIAELIAAQTDGQRKFALSGLSGSTRRKYNKWTESLISVLAHLEASIDFGEDELIGECEVVQNCITKLKILSEEIDDFISVSNRCRDLIQKGVKLVILGKANAGKSTMMNLLCRREKSIVSDLSGTTRDVIEHSFELNGHRITICDTAGLVDTRSKKDDTLRTNVTSRVQFEIDKHHEIELQGIRRALAAARDAELIVYLLDISQRAFDRDELVRIIDDLGPERRLRALHLVINKIDIESNKNPESLASYKATIEFLKLQYSSIDLYFSTISCRTLENFSDLIENLGVSLDKLQQGHQKHQLERKQTSGRDQDKNTFDDHKQPPTELNYVNERHLSLLRLAHEQLSRASATDFQRIDEMAQHVRESIDYLSRIVGTITNEQVVDIIFKDFCIGK